MTTKIITLHCNVFSARPKHMHVAKCTGIIACNAGWAMVIQALVEHMVSHGESSVLLFSGLPALTPYTL